MWLIIVTVVQRARCTMQRKAKTRLYIRKLTKSLTTNPFYSKEALIKIFPMSVADAVLDLNPDSTLQFTLSSQEQSPSCSLELRHPDASSAPIAFKVGANCYAVLMKFIYFILTNLVEIVRSKQRSLVVIWFAQIKG
jgi:hypothetical protein